MPLDLTPNELVGYRIKPDWHSFNVVLVKRKGVNSKAAGQEYDTPLGYCKSIEFAASFIFSHAARLQGELNQKDALAAEGSVADATALLAAFNFAQEHTLKAVAELQARVDALGMSQKALVVAMETASAETELEAV